MDPSREAAMLLTVTASLISSSEKEANPESRDFNTIFSIKKATDFN